jgi:hypothetical protein
MRRTILCATLTLFCAAPLARATNFAVLLGSSGKTEASVSFDHKSPVLDITGMTVTFDPADLPADATLSIDTDPTLPAGAISLTDAFTFAISLQDNADGHLIHQFSHPVQVNFAVTNSPKVSDFGMSRLLETTTPPTWIVQDANLTTKDDNGNHYLCGTTDHFSYYALTPLSSVPEPASAGLLLALPALAGLRRR